MNVRRFPSMGETDCPRVRLAAGELAAVDRCGCGMFQLHLGAFTLRLAPEALSSLVATLREAVAASADDSLGSAATTDRNQRWSQS